MTLDQIRHGQRVVIEDILDRGMRVQALRLGLGTGSVVQCIEVLPAGPVIIKSGHQELALGRRLARLVRVKPYDHKAM